MPHDSSVTCIVSPDEEYQHQLQQHHHQQHHKQQLLVFGQADNAPAPTVSYADHFSISSVNNGGGSSGGEFALQQYYNPNYDVHMEDSNSRYNSSDTTSTELPPLPEDITSSGNCYYFTEQSTQFPTTTFSDQMDYSSSNSLLNEMIMPLGTFGTNNDQEAAAAYEYGELLGGSTITTTSGTTPGSYNYFGFDELLQPQQPQQYCSSNMQDDSNNTTLGYWFSGN
ncbi:hypothetical protein K7X08_031277 [Anisodus acutangulus]|uniref:Uncharacterized protein n=1 Tax=Anisodus acutangulus TaxID=402998 RepID=A0A9Q1MKV0_9SOLA|nr:hypothetical protein K7X08_031277 [Anisodus acutangulus]